MKTYKPSVLSQNVMQSVTYLAERERSFFIFPTSEYAKDEKLKPFPLSVGLHALQTFSSPLERKNGVWFPMQPCHLLERLHSESKSVTEGLGGLNNVVV